jgi:hypothetical protein
MNNLSKDSPHTPLQKSQSVADLAWHPIGRGIGAGIVTAVITNKSFFSNGFIYGGISGLTNLALRPMRKKINERVISSEAKALNHLFFVIAPWIVSAGIMSQAYRGTNIAIFRINPYIGVGTAFMVEAFGSINRELLRTEQKS